MDLLRHHELNRASTVSLGLTVLLALFWLVQTGRYVPKWTDRLELARHTATLAPEKPRALMNFGVYMATRGQIHVGRVMLEHAVIYTRRPYIRPWDKMLMEKDLTQNLNALATLEATIP